jgi:hypothetical protein
VQAFGSAVLIRGCGKKFGFRALPPTTLFVTRHVDSARTPTESVSQRNMRLYTTKSWHAATACVSNDHLHGTTLWVRVKFSSRPLSNPEQTSEQSHLHKTE